MFDVKLEGVDELVKKLDIVINKTHSLQYTMPREYEDWRSEDMHSRYPHPLVTKRRRITRIFQRIYQRGPGSTPKHKRRRRRGYSRRPVLRPGLYDQLKQRMIDLVNETVQWP
jgi:hypothetical protein